MKNQCQCCDPGCKIHLGNNQCHNKAKNRLKRVDMEDITGTPMCEQCTQDAFNSGLYFVDITAKIKYGLE